LIAGVPVTWATLLFVPALLLVCVTMAWMNLVIAMVGARFRDLQPIIGSVLQLVFFVTPLIWDRHLVVGKVHDLFVDANPFYHLVEIMRAPLLGRAPSSLTIATVTMMAVVGWYITYLLFVRFRRRIPYWL